MKANELRIGNWINTGEFHSKELQGEHQYVGDWYKYTHMFTPIPLTEQWLVDLGFKLEKGSNYDMYILNTFWIIHNEKGYEPPIFFGMYLLYVHQLQNLYFALTGEEIEKTNISNENQ